MPEMRDLIDLAADARRDGRLDAFADLTNDILDHSEITIPQLKAELRNRGVDLDAQTVSV